MWYHFVVTLRTGKKNILAIKLKLGLGNLYYNCPLRTCLGVTNSLFCEFCRLRQQTSGARTVDFVPAAELGFPVSEHFLRGNIGPQVSDGSSGLQRRIGRADEP